MKMWIWAALARDDSAAAGTAGRRMVLSCLSALYLTGLAIVAIWPTPVDRPLAGFLAQILNALREFPFAGGAGYGHIEGGANVLLFVPFGVLAALILPVRRWWLAVACGALTSGAIEIIQFVSLSQRHASLADVVNNTLGALLGAAAVRIIQKPPDRGKAPGTASKPIRKSNEGGVPCEPSQTQQT